MTRTQYEGKLLGALISSFASLDCNSPAQKRIGSDTGETRGRVVKYPGPGDQGFIGPKGTAQGTRPVLAGRWQQAEKNLHCPCCNELHALSLFDWHSQSHMTTPTGGGFLHRNEQTRTPDSNWLFGKRSMQPKPLYIKNLRVNPPLILAPMSGLSHTALRQLVAEYGGCGLYYSEMLSARSLPSESPDVSPWLRFTARERPIIYQILVASVDELPKAIEKIESSGADGMDLNMGCTSALIIKRGGGIALMQDRKRAEAIVSSSRRATHLPLTVKIRLGWTLDWHSLKDFCLMLETNGVDAISVHPRLKQDRLKRPARWEYISRIKELLDIPVIGNGDVDTPETAVRMFKQTGCDGVMIGRAAVCRPWLFSEVAGSLAALPHNQSTPNPPDVFNRFVALLDSFIAVEYGLPLLKRFTYYFARNYAFGHTLWRLVYSADSLKTAAVRANEFFKSQEAKKEDS